MSDNQYFGHLGEVNDPYKFFKEQNYIICRGATSSEKIDSLVGFYNRNIVNSKKKYLRQSAQWEKNNKSVTGGVVNGFLNPHSYEKGVNREFSEKILAILDSGKIQNSLLKISNRKDPFKLVQTMLFDQNTTRPHQDWIYLDSKPNGQMIAAWIALEDIYSDGIRFFVYPGTQNFTPKAAYTGSRGMSKDYHQKFIEEIDNVLATGKYEIYAPPLKKGDIFFWGSRLVHGSIAGENINRRRRSIAAHFLPDGLKYGNLQEEIPVKYKIHSSNLSYAYKEGLDDGFYNANSLYRRLKRSPLYRKIRENLSIGN